MAITTNDKNLGHATAYAYAKSKGYTGTEEEFAELMASYATVAESAEESRQAAEAAQGKAEDAQAAAEAAQGVAEQAKDTAVSAKDTAVSSATTATTKAGEASSSASSASSSASSAAGSATSAASSASAASESAATATTKAGEASDSATAAATAQEAAEDAQEAAENAAASVSASATQIATNTEDISDLKNALDMENVSFTSVDGHYIYINGNIGDSAVLSYSNPIPVNKGNIIEFTASGYLQNVAMISVVNSAGTIFTPKVTSIDSAEHKYVYTAEADGYIAVSYWTDKRHNLVIKGSKSNEALYNDLSDVKSDLTDVTVDGYNLIKIAEHGVGAYYASGSILTFNASYTSYHYAIMPVEPNSRYYVSYSPRWWVLTDDDNNVLSSGTGFNPYTKRYIETGNATKFYYTIDNGTWNNEATYGARYALIVSKSNTGSGSRDNVSKPEWLNGLSQRMCDSKYAFAFNRTRFKFTKNANKKFYFKNLLALDSNYAQIYADALNVEGTTKDYISITFTSTGEKAMVGYVFDANLSLVEQQSDIKCNVADDNLSNCSALVIGDSTVEQNVMTQKMLDAFTARDKTLTLLGTRGTVPNLHEGRSGWSAKQYCTQSADNPFYNNGFDFSHYMTAQGYSAVDFVVLQIGINDLYNVGIYNSDDKIAETMGYVCTMIDSILAWNASQKIIVNLLTPVNPNYTGDYMYVKRNIFVRYNAKMLLEITKYNLANVRPSDTFAILDPESDISDNVHPTAIGYEKMANEVVNQINCWQNGA